jgi:ATP-dependent RNA helicase DeaD
MSSFEALGLRAETLRSLETIGFTTPTPVQEQAIPLLLKSEKDVVALAQTGTGKTAAFGLPMLEFLDPQDRTIQVWSWPLPASCACRSARTWSASPPT